MWLVNLQKLYRCLWKLSLLPESHWVACITWFLKKKFPNFCFYSCGDLRSHSKPLYVHWSYILTIITSIVLCIHFYRDFSWNKLTFFPSNAFDVPFNSLRKMLVTQFTIFFSWFISLLLFIGLCDLISATKFPLQSKLSCRLRWSMSLKGFTLKASKSTFKW